MKIRLRDQRQLEGKIYNAGEIADVKDKQLAFEMIGNNVATPVDEEEYRKEARKRTRGGADVAR